MRGLTFDIPRGITYCLLAPNGSGKTTLFRILLGLSIPDSGEGFVLGEPLDKVRSIYPKLGYMTQHKALYPDLTLQENMEFYAGLFGIKGRRREEKISYLLDMVNLEEHRNRITGTLSGGMYQRLSLACTLIHEPELLFLDEPTVGVDPVMKQAFWEYFRAITDGGATIIMTTHVMEEAEKCDMVGFFKAGQMIAQDTPRGIKRIAGLTTRLLAKVSDPSGSAARIRELGFDVSIAEETLNISIDDPSMIRDILEVVGPAQIDLREPSMEDAFVKLTEGA